MVSCALENTQSITFVDVLLCVRIMGRVTRLPVRPSVTQWLVTRKQKKRRKVEVGITVSKGARLKPISQLRFDYDTTTTRLRRKTGMFIFCLRRIASNGSRRARYGVVGS